MADSEPRQVKHDHRHVDGTGMTVRRSLAASIAALALGTLAGSGASADTTPPPLWGPGAPTTTTTPSAPTATGPAQAPPTSQAPTATGPAQAPPTSQAPPESDGRRLVFTTPYYRRGAHLPVSCRRAGRRTIPCRVDVEMRFDHRGRVLRRRLRVGAGRDSEIVLAMSTQRYCSIHVIGVETFVVGTDRRTSFRNVGMAGDRPVCA